MSGPVSRNLSRTTLHAGLNQAVHFLAVSFGQMVNNGIHFNTWFRCFGGASTDSLKTWSPVWFAGMMSATRHCVFIALA